MGLLSNLGNWLGGLLRPQAKPAARPAPQAAARPQPNYNLGNFLAQHLGQAANSVSHAVAKIPDIHLQGLEQFTGNKNITVGKVAQHVPVLGQALKVGQQTAAGHAPSVGQFVKGITGAGIQGAGYVAPELKVIRVPGAAARFVNQAIPAAGLSAAGDLVGGNRNGKEIAQNAALNAGLAGAAHAVLGRGVKLPVESPKQVPLKVKAPVALPASTAKVSEKGLLVHAADPDLPSVKTKLPVNNLGRESWLRKAIMPSVDIIKRQGRAGQTLGKIVDNQVNAHELYQADLTRQAPTLFKLGRKERANFGDVVEGKAKAVSAKQAQAVKEWKTLAPQVRERGLAAGLEIGDRGPKYFPHMIDFDKLNKRSNFNAALNHLVTSGQAKTHEEAIQLLRHAQDVARNRPHGNLEASRLVDLPFYDKSTDAIGRYITGASGRITQAEHFGFKDEKALRLITRIAREGGDSAAAKDAFDIAAGAKRYGQTASRVSAKLRSFNTLTKLGTAQISNAGQSVNTGTVAGYHRVLKGAIDALSPVNKEFVQKSGVVADAVLKDLSNQQGISGWVGKIGAPGFSTVEKANRTIAALAGRRWANDLAKKGGAKELKLLTEKLGVEGKIGKELTEAQQIQAARKLVEITQFKTGAKDLPGWADSPAGKLVAQFRTFPYKQGNFLMKEVLKPASQGNIAPLARFLAALPIGYGIYETKNVLRNRPDDQALSRRVFESFQALGGAGLAGSVVQGVLPRFGKYLPPGVYASQVAGTLGGPTVSTAGRVADAIGSAATGSWTPAGRLALGNIPVVGGTLSNTILPYAGVGNRTDATAEASSSAPAPKASSGGDLLTGDNTSPEYKQTQKDAKAQKAADLKSGKRLGGTEELDKAQQRIDTAEKKLPAGISKASRDTLLRYAKLNENGKEIFESDPRNKYLLETAKYEQDKKSGKLSTLEDFSRTQTLGKLEVTSRYSKEAQTLYGMSKANRTAFLSEHPEYGAYMGEAAAMDAELAAKGWISKAKLGTGGRSSAQSRKYATLQGKISNHPGKLSGTSLKGYKVKRVKIKP